MNAPIVIGSRGSALALWQARSVRDALRRALPGVAVEIKTISTKGDRILDTPLEKVGDKGLFTKELESALLAREVDVCVHSMKDVPAELPAGCAIAAMLPRADVRDALVCGPRIQAASLADVPAGSRLGTGSLRRSAQLRARHPRIVVKPIRGNVDTRLAKAEGPDYEGAVLAAAGVIRMGAEPRISAYLPIYEMLPAVGQGAIGIEAREDDARIAEMLAAIDDAETSACVKAERRILAALEGGCLVPLGAYARMEEGRFLVDAGIFSPDGSKAARAHVERPTLDEAGEAADEAVRLLLGSGAREILDEIREAGGAS